MKGVQEKNVTKNVTSKRENVTSLKVTIFDLLAINPDLRPKEICSKLSLDFSKMAKYVRNVRSEWKKASLTPASIGDPDFSDLNKMADSNGVTIKNVTSPGDDLGGNLGDLGVVDLGRMVLRGSKMTTSYDVDRGVHEKFMALMKQNSLSSCYIHESIESAIVGGFQEGTKKLPGLFNGVAPVININFNINQSVDRVLKRSRRSGSALDVENVLINYVGSALECSVCKRPSVKSVNCWHNGSNVDKIFFCESHFVEYVKRFNKGKLPRRSASYFPSYSGGYPRYSWRDLDYKGV